MYRTNGQWTQMQPQQTRLPAGWEAKWDPNTSRWFYLNHNTRKTQWEPPTQQTQTATPVQTTTSFIQADPEKLKILLKEYENLSPNYAGTTLRMHQNNLQSVRATLAARGYKKKSTVEPKSHFVFNLKKQFPEAPEDVVKEVLISTSNNFVGARTSLESMGFKRVYETEAQQKTQATKKPTPAASVSATRLNASVKPKKTPAPAKELSASEKKARIEELKRKYPDIRESLIKLSLEGTRYDVNMASAVLQASVDSVNTTLRTGKSKTTFQEKEEGEIAEPACLEPVIFGGEEERRELKPTTSTILDDLCVNLDSVTTSKKPQQTTQYSAVKKREAFKPKIMPVSRRPVAGAHVSALRLVAVGPNPALCNGPNRSLLLDGRTRSMGPNRALRQGPLHGNRCGPHRSNAKGRANIDAGPSGAVGPAMLVV